VGSFVTTNRDLEACPLAGSWLPYTVPARMLEALHEPLALAAQPLPG